MSTPIISHTRNAAPARTTGGTKSARSTATPGKGWNGQSGFVSQKTLDRIADAEYSARTDGGWKTQMCMVCYTRRSANGTCNCN